MTDEALSAAIRTVNKAGYAVVPREVNDNQIVAGIAAWKKGKFATITIYKAMLTAGEIKEGDI